MTLKIVLGFLENASLRLATVFTAGAYLIVTAGSQSAHAQALVEECNRFAAVVNQNQQIIEAFEVEVETFSQNAADAETLEEITSAASDYVDALDDVTTILNDLASDLEKIQFTDDQLLSYRDDYIGILSGFNGALRVIGNTMGEIAASESESELLENLEAAQEETIGAVTDIQALADNESDIILNVNGYCNEG